MGRILRKKRFGSEENENFTVGKSNSSQELNTISSLRSAKREALMDKTNALKAKDGVKQKIVAAAPTLKDEKRTQKSKETEVNHGKITRRRQSSKENVWDPGEPFQIETESKPLGDKTNVAEFKKMLRGSIVENGDDKDIKSQDSKRSPTKESVSDEIYNSVSLECPVRKQPPRNAAKFKRGWISELRGSKTSPLKLRACQGAKDDETGKDFRPGAKLKGNLPFRNERSVKRQQEVHQNSISNKPKPLRSPRESDSRSEGSEDEEVACQQPVASNLRKLPSRNAAKFEKGWIAALRKFRNSKDSDSDVRTSFRKRQSQPLNDQASEEVERSGGKEDMEMGNDNSKSLDSLEAKKDYEKALAESCDEKDPVPELQKTPERLAGRRKNRLGSSAQDAAIPKVSKDGAPKYVPPGASVAESRHRGLEDFESRIAAKLGIDMNASASTTKPKDAEKNPAEEASSNLALKSLRKRRVDKKIKEYAEADETKGEIEVKSVTSRGCKVAGKSPVNAKTVPLKAKTHEHKGVSYGSTTGDADEGAPSASTSQKEKDPCSGITANNEIDAERDLRSVPLNPTDHGPKPGCSWYPEVTSRQKSGNSESPHSAKKSLSVTPTSSLFSLFKKPETPRRSSCENKIFVSSSKPCNTETATESTEKKQLPVYGNPCMTPLKRMSGLPHDKKEELYDFEVDENEPKPKKKHKPIMKIQRVRAVKRKKPKVYEADPETELRVLRNLDLSPSLLQGFQSAKKQKVENAAGVVTSQPSISSYPVEATKNNNHHPSFHDFDLPVEPMSSPCRDYGQSTPMRSDAPSLIMDDARDKFGRLSAKVYSPVKSKDSPIPVLMAEYNNDEVQVGDSSRRSDAINASRTSIASGNSIYHNDLDVSASTPVKFNKNDSTYSASQKPKPIELNISNCFGFDEPEMMEEPLVSPIRSTDQVTLTTAPVTPLKPVPILKSKPPVMLPPRETPAVDVGQVIKQLRFEVGDDSSANNSANISVYGDSEITLKHKSPIKRYFQPKEDPKHKANKSADETTLNKGNDSFSPIKVAQKVPRLSYERPRKLRKKQIVEPVYSETSEHEDDERTEESDVEHEIEHPETIFQPTKNKALKEGPKKREKGMTKKEEEELEKWALMFNSQCNQIDSLNLIVE